MPIQPTVALIADDLTGALDAAAPFVAQGLTALVATSLTGVSEMMAQAAELGADVVSVSTNSRELPPEQAIERASQAAQALHGAIWMFKKIDSRMKGHVAPELRAVGSARGARAALLSPAIPAMGRVVQDQQLRGFGVDRAVDLLAVARDSGLAVDIPDALSDADLDRAVAGTGPDVVMCGARGLAAALARRIGKGALVAISPVLPQPISIVIGSRDPITMAQCDRLREFDHGISWTAAPDGVAPGVMPTGNSILQVTTGGNGTDGAKVSALLAAGFVRGHVAGRRSLVLTGGETASAVLAALGIEVLQLLGEVADGLPLSKPLNLEDAPLIVTKSGGFGPPDVLCDLFSKDSRR